jgi:hypothetical protein
VTTTTLVLALTWPRWTRSDGVAGDVTRDVAGDVTGDLTGDVVSAGDRGNVDHIDRVIIESDPSGGSLIGWLALNPQRTLTSAVTRRFDDTGPADRPMTGWERSAQVVGDGLAVLASPIRSVEAATSQTQAHRSTLAEIGSVDGLVAFIDAGRGIPGSPWTPAGTGLVVMVHRQRGGPAAAAGVRVEQLRERYEILESAGHRLAVVVIGAHPFDPADIATHLGGGDGAVMVALPEDRFAAEVLAGRTGCSARRLHRLGLMRAGRDASLRLHAAASSPAGLASPGLSRWGQGR